MADMSADERALMADHRAYMKQHIQSGMVIALGPVLDPAGGWGLALIESDDAEHLEQTLAHDPTILSGRGFRYDTHPIPRLTLGRGADRASTFSVTP